MPLDRLRELTNTLAEIEGFESHGFGAQLANASPDAIVVTDAPGRIVFVNRAAVLLWQYDRTEMLGQAVEMLLPEAARARHVEHRAQYLQRMQSRSMGANLSLTLRRKDGVEIPANILLEPMVRPDGVFVITIVRRKDG